MIINVPKKEQDEDAGIIQETLFFEKNIHNLCKIIYEQTSKNSVFTKVIDVDIQTNIILPIDTFEFKE